MSSEPVIRRIDLAGPNREERLRCEWLLTNGLGGYASGTLAGDVSRRYHGLLIAGLPAPLGRVVMFNHLVACLVLGDGRRVPLASGAEASDGLTEFRLEYHTPVWRYDIDDVAIEKRIELINGQNTVHVNFRLLSNSPDTRLDLHPYFHFRPHEENVTDAAREYSFVIRGGHYEIQAGGLFPALRLAVFGQPFTLTHEGDDIREIVYRIEAERGYPARGQLWSPGKLAMPLPHGVDVTLIASTEPWSTIQAIKPAAASRYGIERSCHLLSLADDCLRDSEVTPLVLAADQFITTPLGRVEDATRARAVGEEVRTVVAGYHWFTDWGRDTMISLEGLTLVTGRHEEARSILKTFAYHIRDGLIPNLFPEGDNTGLYHTADATLWFFHALDRYLDRTGDRELLDWMLPRLREVIEHHERGTHFNIGVDPEDGLMRQGAESYQLTWMDAKVEDWVVTPRRGKAVEINALWYNALKLIEGWLAEAGDQAAAARVADRAAQAKESFNRRFWIADRRHLYDVVDGESGDDAACRPNQLFAISLKHEVLARDRWTDVIENVRSELLTPYGLRSLSPDHPDYKSRYFGDLRARDAAYHQGTVWGWLIGPFIDAWLKIHPERKLEARDFLSAFVDRHLNDSCIGTIAEIFDAGDPYTPRGCVAQAWSVAEVLRCWAKTETPESSGRKRGAPLQERREGTQRRLAKSARK
jgi:predicted glycogen debranching enzyme